MAELTRLSRSTYFMAIAQVVAKRATCPRLSVGAIIVSQSGQILATGYNGAPSQSPHCIDDGCVIESDHCTRTVHAEANAIASAARHGVKVDGATMYTTHSPCSRCLALVTNAGIISVHYGSGYRLDAQTLAIANESQIELYPEESYVDY